MRAPCISILLGLCLTAAVPAAGGVPPSPGEIVKMVSEADVVFTGKVRGSVSEEVFFSTREEADAARASGMRLLGSAAPGLKPNVFYHQLNYQITVGSPLKGNVRQGSMLKTKVALADKKELLEAFDPGWPKYPKAKDGSFGPDGGLFILKADASGFTFQPLLLDFAGRDPAEAKRRRLIAVTAIGKALAKDPHAIVPHDEKGVDVLARLKVKAKKVGADRYRLAYDFSSQEQLKDWRVVNRKGEWIIEDGWLVQNTNVTGGGAAGATVLVTRAEFEGDVEVVVRVQPVDNDILTTHIAYYCRNQNYVFLMDSDGARPWSGGRVIGPRFTKDDRFWHVWSDYDPDRVYTIAMGRKGPNVYVKLDGRLLFEARDEVLKSGSVAVGCTGQEGARFDSIEITGKPSGVWRVLEPKQPVVKPPPKTGRKKK
jgi:hypothetical protein